VRPHASGEDCSGPCKRGADRPVEKPKQSREPDPQAEPRVAQVGAEMDWIVGKRVSQFPVSGYGMHNGTITEVDQHSGYCRILCDSDKDSGKTSRERLKKVMRHLSATQATKDPPRGNAPTCDRAERGVCVGFERDSAADGPDSASDGDASPIVSLFSDSDEDESANRRADTADSTTEAVQSQLHTESRARLSAASAASAAELELQGAGPPEKADLQSTIDVRTHPARPHAHDRTSVRARTHAMTLCAQMHCLRRRLARFRDARTPTFKSRTSHMHAAEACVTARAPLHVDRFML
jgi:hypothetical protein